MRCLRCSTGSSLPQAESYNEGQTQNQINFTDSCASCDSSHTSLRLAKTLTEHLDLEFSTITDAIDPTVTITESLALLFQHTSKKPCDYPDIAQMRNMSDTAKDTAAIGEGATTSAHTTPPLFSPPGTDLRMD